MPKDLNFVVVGLGMGVHHCTAVKAAQGARLHGVCDLDPARLKTEAEKHGVRAYASFEEVLKDPAVDVVNIVTESGHHARMGIAAARAGKHIVCEKPIDVTPGKIAKLEAEVAKSGVKCACIVQLRLEKCNALLKKAVDGGKMGRVFGVNAALPWYRSDAYYTGPHGPWRGTWELDGGGSLMNQGIHTVDLMQWFGGRVKRVSGFFRVQCHPIEAEDHTVAVLEFQSGALGSLMTTTCSQPDMPQRLHVFGEKGSFTKTGGRLESYEIGTAQERARMLQEFGLQVQTASADPMSILVDGHTIIFADLVKAIRQDREPVITIQKAKHSVEIIHAIYESGRKRKVIELPET